MHNPIGKPFAAIVSFMLFVSLACSLSGISPVSAPPATSTPASGGGGSATTVAPTAPAADTPVSAATAASVSGGGGGGCANPYYPATAGDSWSYTSASTTATGTPVSSYIYTTTVTAASNRGFTTDVLSSLGVDSTIKWDCQGGKLTVLDVGAVSTAPSKTKLNYNSVSAVGYNVPASLDSAATWGETITATAQITTTANRTVNSQIVSQLDCTAAGTDKVSLPLGNFDTVKATCGKTVTVSAVVQGKVNTMSTVQESLTYWYAKNVGLVKSVGMIGTGGSSAQTAVPSAITTVTLTQYQVH